jgi:hypothetical protein
VKRLFFLIGCAACASTQTNIEPGERGLEMKVAQFTIAELAADTTALPESEKRALGKIIEAAKLLDPIFDRQVYAENPTLREKLALDQTEEGKHKLAYFDIMRGPWDRQDHFKPFAIDIERPKGAGFYPTDLSAEEFKKYVADHPDQKVALESLFTIVTRVGNELKAVGYSEAYADWLQPAAQRLREAAALTKNESLKRFLELRANAFLSDDYYESDKAWMDLESLVEVTIGPYETYEDELLGLKASFEAFVTVTDPKESEKLARFKALLPEMEKHLPVPDDVKTVRGSESPIRVVDLVYTSGDARKSVQTAAFNLPNDERVRKEKGSKKVMLKNTIQTKFDRIMRPIAEQILDESQLRHLSAEAFFDEILFHELSHGLGPAYATKDGKQIEVRAALEASFSPLEEGKADVMGAYNILFMIQKGEFPADFREKLLVSYFAGLFRSVRFGVAEAHGRGAAMQINRYLEEGAATFDEATGKFTVDFDQLEKSIETLVHDICMLQHHGDKAGVDALLAKYGVMSKPMEQALSKTGGVPVDLRPVYPLAQ